MRRLIFPVILVSLALSGCARLANSSANPGNWFKREGAAPSAPAPAPVRRALVPAGSRAITVDGRGLINRVSTVEALPTSGGLLVRATGLAATQGYYNAELVPTQIKSGTLTLSFRAQSQATPQPAGAASSREITVATVLSRKALAGVRRIQVRGFDNSKTVRAR